MTEKINKLSEEDIRLILEKHFEDVEAQKVRLEEAPEIAERLIDLVFRQELRPMDIWEVLASMFDNMGKRSNINWFHGDYIRAMVPVLIENVPEAHEIFINVIAGLEKHNKSMTKSIWEAKNNRGPGDVLDSDIIQ